MRELQQTHPTKVLTYTLDGPRQLQQDDPPYLQTYVYDTLTDSGWQTTDYTANETQASTMPTPQGLTDMAAYQQFKISVNVTERRPDQPVGTQFPGHPLSGHAGHHAPRGLAGGSRAHGVLAELLRRRPGLPATSVDVDPTAAQLRVAPRPPSSLAADLKLPASYEVRALKQIADLETAGQTTEYGKVNALAAWLSGPTFSYKREPRRRSTPPPPCFTS